MIDPKCRKTNRPFVQSFKVGKNHPTRDSLVKYSMLLVEIKDFNVLIDNKAFFDQPKKNEQEAYEKLVEISRNYDYTKANLLDYSYHQKYGKLLAQIQQDYSSADQFHKKIR